MNAIILTVGLALILFGGYIAALNWWGLYASCRDKSFHSSIPFIGSMFLGTGMFLIPATRRYTATAIFIDYGTLVLLLSIPVLARRFLKARARS